MACGDILTTPPYPDWMPIDFAVNADMSGTWKLLDSGGHSKELHMEHKGLQCYHHEMLSPASKVEEMQEEVSKVSEKLTVPLE
eukprot:scaffold60711_cov65-Attheya_sp.AAC.2